MMIGIGEANEANSQVNVEATRINRNILERKFCRFYCIIRIRNSVKQYSRTG